MSGEAFSNYFFVHINSMNKVLFLLNSKNICININNKYSEYNNYLKM